MIKIYSDLKDFEFSRKEDWLKAVQPSIQVNTLSRVERLSVCLPMDNKLKNSKSAAQKSNLKLEGLGFVGEVLREWVSL